MQRMCFLFVLFALLAAAKSNASNLVLNWTASASSSVVGYDVYYGTTSGIYLYKINVGNTTGITISNLAPGVTYYLVATAYDVHGNQSFFSNQISYAVPASGLLTIAHGAKPGTPVIIQFPATPGHWYEIQATSNLRNWTSVWQTGVALSNTSMQFTDPNSPLFASRFYRLVQH
jgi:hypothetical protein